jgi:FtsZ-binding cell division protein ZapB
MKRYINTKENMVMFAPPKGWQADCSAFLDKGIVLIAEDENGFWYETEPFTGQIRELPEPNLVMGLFMQAEKAFDAQAAQTQQSPVDIRIEELHVLLRESDHKVLPDYDKPNNAIKEQRKAWREEIRQLGG